MAGVGSIFQTVVKAVKAAERPEQPKAKSERRDGAQTGAQQAREGSRAQSVPKSKKAKTKTKDKNKRASTAPTAANERATTRTRASARTRADRDTLTTQDVMSKQQLEQKYPNLKGKLDPPKDSKPPAGVEVRQEGNARIVTVNMRGAVPLHAPNEDREHEDVQAMRDIASYVRSIDADVVMVNEVRQGTDPKQDGVQRQVDVLFHLLDADSVVYGGRTKPGSSEKFRGDMNLGNAVFTRNGYTINTSANVDLQNSGQVTRDDTSIRAQARDAILGGNSTQSHTAVFQNNTALIASVVEPDGGSFSVVSTHINSVGLKAADGNQYTQLAAQIRQNQLQRINQIVQQIESGQAINYRTPISVENTSSTGFGSDAVVIAGDFNTSRSTIDKAWRGADITSGWQFLSAEEANARGANRATYLPKTDSQPIDHMYISGGSVASGGRNAIGFTGPERGYANDHAAVYFDVETEEEKP